MRRTPSVFPSRPFRASGVANVIAPSQPLGRARSAVAITAVLVGVQMVLLAARVPPDLCRAAGFSCSPVQIVVGGGVLQNQINQSSQRPPTGSRAASPAPHAADLPRSNTLHLVALHIPAGSRPGLKASAIKLIAPRSATTPAKHRSAQAAVVTTKHAAGRQHHGKRAKKVGRRHHRHHRGASRLNG